jgi:hypothetical protein
MEQKKKKTVKPKPKVKPKTEKKKEKKPEKKEKSSGRTIITIIKQQDHSVIDNFYDRKVNNIIKKIILVKCFFS